MRAGLVVQLGAAFVVAAAGLLLLAVGAVGSGVALLLVGGLWLARCLARL